MTDDRPLWVAIEWPPATWVDLERALHERGIEVEAREPATLLGPQERPVTVVLAHVGSEREDEVILMTRALSRRPNAPAVALVGRGAVVESESDAFDAGGHWWFAALDAAALGMLTPSAESDEVPDLVAKHDEANAIGGLVRAHARAPSVADALERARYGTYYEFLGLPADVGVDEIADAVVALRARFDDADHLAPRIRDELLDAIDAAWAVLGNAGLRHRYRAALAAHGDQHAVERRRS